MEQIQFAIDNCYLGSLLAAQSSIGLCALFFGNDLSALKCNLQSRFPNATLKEGGMEKLLPTVIKFVTDPLLPLDMPLDERGTEFQRSVWKALREIHIGTTVSYTEIAKKIGKPKAVRAVAQACAQNPLAVITPCHRVVSKDGSLSGYRWGIERKKSLLLLEKSL